MPPQLKGSMNIDSLPNELVYAGARVTKAGPGKWNRCVNYNDKMPSGILELFLGNIVRTGPDWFTVCVVPDTTVAEVWCGSGLLPGDAARPGRSVLVGPLQWYGQLPRALGAWLVENRSTGVIVRVRGNSSAEIAEDQTGIRYYLPSIRLLDASIGEMGSRVQFTRAQTLKGPLAQAAVRL